MSLTDRQAPKSAAEQIFTLTPRDVDSLRLGWQTKIEPDDLRRILDIYPGRSVWLPETLEFAVVSPWRHRSEIANVQELVAVRHPDALLAAVVERCTKHDATLVVSIELEEVRRPAFYAAAGFDFSEEVVTYELERLPASDVPTTSLRFEQVDLANEKSRALLAEIDHRSFPWLWWNSDLEFQVYGLAPGVEVYIGYDGNLPVSYVGLTSYLGWGHLDRIAVFPEHQGRGWGQEALKVAIARLARLGARRVGLSTQRDNIRSQHLYEGFGFRRTWGNDYRLYGRFLRPVGEYSDPSTSNRSGHLVTSKDN